ncbi:MAG: SCO family protein [Methylococcus sp.]|nr:SCO family protein [Methylococcus sp.]
MRPKRVFIRRRIVQIVAITLVAVFAALLGLLAWEERARRVSQLVSGTLLPQARAISDFALTGDDGKAYTRADLLGHWTVVFTGYTHCPDVCPTTLSQLKAAKARLGAHAARLAVLFVSVDPERDAPDHLARYVRYFDKEFRAATAPVEVLTALGRQLGFVFFRNPGPEGESYSVDHSAELVLIDPKARLAGYLTPPFYAETLAADLKTVLER